MPGRRLLVAAACAALALVAPGVAAAADLVGTVGPTFTITLRDAAGQPVTKLDPGSYRITVTDQSEFHNFHLFGPGVNVATDVEASGTVVWDVTLVEGIYTFQCDPHKQGMRGTFRVIA